ncbi:hypothetical protein RHSIM_Rhsim02G0149400 [Rhododendron simsii]|uniref:Reverse transcriptase domain-containing protein n=1 Tax=Rhododendron simsii TaxID=118357 RepID=A0A834LUC1_RHOSS|nr:hypothetical protein RHSIM_Rhsim02G0149400 [Rhododendron simsii]
MSPWKDLGVLAWIGTLALDTTDKYGAMDVFVMDMTERIGKEWMEGNGCVSVVHGDGRRFAALIVVERTRRRIISKRLQVALPALIDPAQSGFVKGRRIADIFLTQELMRWYHKSSSSPRCAKKVDIRKAYDNVRWEFLWDVLSSMNFHPTMIKWLQACVTTTNYTLSLNGETTGCGNTKIINLCFADDLMIFCKGELSSITLIQEALTEFQALSGLSSNPKKSSIYFSGVATKSWRVVASSNSLPLSGFKGEYLTTITTIYKVHASAYSDQLLCSSALPHGCFFCCLLWSADELSGGCYWSATSWLSGMLQVDV